MPYLYPVRKRRRVKREVLVSLTYGSTINFIYNVTECLCYCTLYVTLSVSLAFFGGGAGGGGAVGEDYDVI